MLSKIHVHPDKVMRESVRKLTDLPNIGPSLAKDLELIGITKPGALANKDPLDLYKALCEKTGHRQDPCVLDTFISIVRFMSGEEPRVWWAYTAERKEKYKV